MRPPITGVSRHWTRRARRPQAERPGATRRSPSAGRYDWICPPSQAHILHEGLPNSELVIFEESGHLPYVEEPELFFDTVRRLVRR